MTVLRQEKPRSRKGAVGKVDQEQGETAAFRGPARAWATHLLILIFFGSGATSLVYQTIWVRQLQLVFGTSQLAVSTVLAAFMGGLALGGFIAARWARRVARPLWAYAALEAFIGLYALAFPIVLRLIQPLYVSTWSALEPSPAAFGAFQLLLLGTLLLPPTICMGATLPLLSGFVTERLDEAGLQVGRLYGANTLGAVLGAGLAGFVLLPQIGLASTTGWAAFANLALAAAVLLLPGARDSIGARKPLSESEGVDDTTQRVPALLMIAAFAGFSGLLYEVAWFRLMVLILGGSAYAFSIMLVSFLLGIGVGGWIGGPRADRALREGGRARVLRHLAWLQAGVAAVSWAAMYTYSELPFAFVWLYDNWADGGATLWLAKLLLAMAIMAPPALLMGVSFPYLVRAAAGRADLISRPVGLVYGVNTVGAIVGAAAGGLVLLPALHVRGSVLAAASVNLAAALIAAGAAMGAAGPLRRTRLAALGLAGAGAMALAHWQKPPWNPLLMSSGVYEYVTDMEDFSREGLLEFAVEPFELLFYDEGLSSVVIVARDESNNNIWLANNGKVDASSQTDLETQVLSAHLPFAFRPDAGRVLVIGLASGISAGSVTLHRAPGRIDLVEIEPAVVEASREFDAVNHRPLDDPRVRLHLNDARHHLSLTEDGTYDLVSAEPSNPWLSGVSNLFTREFFALGRSKLSPRGIWAQWLQTYAMEPADLKSLLATFADVFAHVLVFRVDASDLILLGSDAPLPLHLSKLEGLFQQEEAVAVDLRATGFRRAEDILSLYQFGTETLETLVEGVELNTDDNMRIEYSGPLHLHEDTGEPNTLMLARVAEIPLDAVEGRDALVALVRAYAAHDPAQRRGFAVLRAAEELSPGDPEIRALLRAYEEMARAMRASAAR